MFLICTKLRSLAQIDASYWVSIIPDMLQWFDFVSSLVLSLSKMLKTKVPENLGK